MGRPRGGAEAVRRRRLGGRGRRSLHVRAPVFAGYSEGPAWGKARVLRRFRLAGRPDEFAGAVRTYCGRGVPGISRGKGLVLWAGAALAAVGILACEAWKHLNFGKIWRYMRNFGVRLLLGAVLLVSVAPLPAQRPFSGAAESEESLHKLNELGTMLHIAAHPDDERTAVLAYFARGRHMRTAYLSLTRGEGGQNLIGSEQGAQLGIIRTQELLAARQIDGADQVFSRAIDFGFTRTPEDTLQKWGHDRILSDLVWVIRRYRPDVILLGFSGTPRDGHGQHQASAILGKEAFTAAADPKMFPEQLKYVQVWQAKRLAQAAGFGGFGFAVGGGGGRGGRGGAPAVPPGVVPPAPETETGPYADTGSFNPILGYSYDELAVLSRSMHHSQGTGAMRRPGPGRAGFTITGGTPATNDLFDGIDTSWNRLPGGCAVKAILDRAIRNYET